MSETRINSDGSASLSISADSSPLETSLKDALSALMKFVNASTEALGRFDGAFDKAFRRFGASLGGVDGALDKARETLKNVKLPVPGASGLGDATIAVDQSLF